MGGDDGGTSNTTTYVSQSDPNIQRLVAEAVNGRLIPFLQSQGTELTQYLQPTLKPVAPISPTQQTAGASINQSLTQTPAAYDRVMDWANTRMEQPWVASSGLFPGAMPQPTNAEQSATPTTAPPRPPTQAGSAGSTGTAGTTGAVRGK